MLGTDKGCSIFGGHKSVSENFMFYCSCFNHTKFRYYHILYDASSII